MRAFTKLLVALVVTLGVSLCLQSVSCSKANLQDVLEDQQEKTKLNLIPVYSIVEESAPAKEEAATVSKSWIPLKQVAEAPEDASPEASQVQPEPAKKVKVITIVAPDYSIRFQAKSDAPLVVREELEPEAEESRVEEAEVQARQEEIESTTVTQAESETDYPDASQSSAGAEQVTEEETPEKDLEAEVEVKSKSEKKQKKQIKQSKKEEKINKSDSKQAETAEVNKRSKRETKKSGSGKNGKTKRSAEKSKKYNKSKNNKGKSKK